MYIYLAKSKRALRAGTYKYRVKHGTPLSLEVVVCHQATCAALWIDTGREDHSSSRSDHPGRCALGFERCAHRGENADVEAVRDDHCHPTGFDVWPNSG